MLRCSGNMHVPSLLGVTMCVLDVIFNFLLIFPTRDFHAAGFSFTMPGAGLGVEGAALGTAGAEAVAAAVLLWYLSPGRKNCGSLAKNGVSCLRAPRSARLCV